MIRLVLVRHGQSTWNLENRFTGWTDQEKLRTATATVASQLTAGRGTSWPAE